MATVTGGLFRPVPAAAPVAPAAQPTAGPLSLASVTAHTGPGGGSTSGPQGDVRFSGTAASGTEQVVATQTQVAGNTVLHLPDGSTITLVGITHVDASFIH